MSEKLWSNSGDSHFVEPPELWSEILPKDLARRMPRSERISENQEVIHVDGESFTRQLPFHEMKKDKETGLNIVELSVRPPGARDMRERLKDLENEGIWAEVIYPGVGFWEYRILDRKLVRMAASAENEWRLSELQGMAPDRMVPVAALPLLDIDDAVAECRNARKIGLYAVGLSSCPPKGMDDWNSDYWEPLWTAAEQEGMVVGFHIGAGDGNDAPHRGPGGAILNWVEESYTGQRVVTKMVASGALDRHPGLRILISEGGAGWIPSLADRMDEAYRQHGMFVRPTLTKLPREIIFNQVYTSFMHERSAVSALTSEGYPNVMWGSDYPHMEGTYGHTQKTLHELFDDKPRDVSERIRFGSFRELFPHTAVPPSR